MREYAVDDWRPTHRRFAVPTCRDKFRRLATATLAPLQSTHEVSTLAKVVANRAASFLTRRCAFVKNGMASSFCLRVTFLQLKRCLSALFEALWREAGVWSKAADDYFVCTEPYFEGNCLTASRKLVRVRNNAPLSCLTEYGKEKEDKN